MGLVLCLEAHLKSHLQILNTVTINNDILRSTSEPRFNPHKGTSLNAIKLQFANKALMGCFIKSFTKI